MENLFIAWTLELEGGCRTSVSPREGKDREETTWAARTSVPEGNPKSEGEGKKERLEGIIRAEFVFNFLSPFFIGLPVGVRFIVDGGR